MRLDVNPGKYVVAVSGGVDSMVLLDVLAHMPGLELTVAHFEHGIRPDSDEDRVLVETTAKKYGLPFVFERGRLGPEASEATAREARYGFLRQVCAERQATLMTAHHRDDVLETAIINILRGTGPKGLSALRSTDDTRRPLIDMSKAALMAYAKEHGIRWFEDSTNNDSRYLRNYVRRYVLPRFDAKQQAQLLAHMQKASLAQREIEAICVRLRSSQPSPKECERRWFIMLPHAVASEYLADWLRGERVPFDRRTIARLVVFSKTGSEGKQADIQSGHRLKITKNTVRLVSQSDS